MVSVAIDGPAGAGKSTLARRLAADFGYIYVDTGAMFRTIGLYALRAGKEPKDNEAVDALLPNITLEFAFIEGEQHIYLNGEDVSTAIRTEEVGMAASAVGANPAVRAFLLEMQRDMAKTQNILMDGRDIGTVVLPNATVKIFLTASPEARATRRWKEYQQKGIDTPYEDVLADVKQRDYQDTHRAAAPLKQADDAGADDRAGHGGGDIDHAGGDRLRRVHARAEAQQPCARTVHEHTRLVVHLAPAGVLEHELRAVERVARHAEPRPHLRVPAEGVHDLAVTFFHP